MIVDQDFRDHSALLAKCLEGSRPVQINAEAGQTWTLFTDGAFEPDQAQPGSVGAVLVDPEGRPCHAWGSPVPEHLLSIFMQESSRPIYELEILPVVAALWQWRHLLKNSQLVIYIDNEAAKSSLIRLDGANSASKALTELFSILEDEIGFAAWVGRVASHSNPADGPSRGSFGASCISGASIQVLDWHKLQCECLSRARLFGT